MQTKLSNKIPLPRGYLSWSAISLFKRSKDEFIRHYVYGEETFKNGAMEFGSTFAKAMENDEEHEDPIINMVMQSIPRLPKREYRLESSITTPEGVIPLLGTFDAYCPKTHDVDEYKTGTRKWTKNMAQNHGQMKFYSLLTYLNFKTLENKKRLIWIETEKKNDDIKPTGRIEVYPVSYSQMEILTFAKDVVNTAKEISELYKRELKKVL